MGVALWCETSSELRHSLANSSLRSAADSLAAVVGQVAGRRESGGGVGGGGEGFTVMGDFSDWEESVSVLDGGWLGGREGGGESRRHHDGSTGETLSSGIEGQREASDSNWSPPPHPSPGEGDRQYHSSAVPGPHHTHWRELHTNVPRPHHTHWRELHTSVPCPHHTHWRSLHIGMPLPHHTHWRELHTSVPHPHHTHWRGLHTGVRCGSETVVGGATRQVEASKTKSREQRSKQEVSEGQCLQYRHVCVNNRI